MNMVFLSLQDTGKEFHDRSKNRNDRMPLNGLFALLPMRKKSRVKEYIPSEFESLSNNEREIWLAQQCTYFEEEIQAFYNDSENYVEELNKRLRKLTRRWASWNHRRFGPVVSREQIKELLLWEQEHHPKHSVTSQQNNNQHVDSDNTTENNNSDPLEGFEIYCEKSAKLLHIFRQDIYRPLCDFFSDDDTDNLIKEIPKQLEKCVQKWEALLQFSPVNEKLFNRFTEKLTINNSFRTNGISEADTVLRLVPDLYQKKLEVLRLAVKWKSIANAKIIQRRGTYTLTLPRTLDKRESMPRPRTYAVSHEVMTVSRKQYEDLNERLHKTRTVYMETNKELKDTKETCERVEKEMDSCKLECDHIRDQLRHTAELKKAIEVKVHDSHASSIASLPLEENNNELSSREELWERELERIKTKYSRQKVKFLNARKQIENLNKQLEISQNRCLQLQNSLDETSVTFKKLEDQLELARKNIQTQGNMVDALQHQCYTLKQELDTSNIKKGELYTELSDTLERYKDVENDLKQTKQKYKVLADENGRRRSREEELERENTQLRKIIELQNVRRRSDESNYLPSTSAKHVTLHRYSLPSSTNETRPMSPSKKDCILPDINAGRSF